MSLNANRLKMFDLVSITSNSVSYKGVCFDLWHSVYLDHSVFSAQNQGQSNLFGSLQKAPTASVTIFNQPRLFKAGHSYSNLSLAWI